MTGKGASAAPLALWLNRTRLLGNRCRGKSLSRGMMNREDIGDLNNILVKAFIIISSSILYIKSRVC